jgi:hypothetical protein
MIVYSYNIHMLHAFNQFNYVIESMLDLYHVTDLRSITQVFKVTF